MCKSNCCYAGQHVNWPLDRLYFQLLDWPDDHLMEPLSNEDADLHTPVPEAQTHNTFPLHCDDQHFSSPSTPPPTYGEAGRKTKSLAATRQYKIMILFTFPRLCTTTHRTISGYLRYPSVSLTEITSQFFFPFSNSCQYSPARSLPCPDTTQCATRNLCCSASFTHAELERTATLRGGQTPPVSIWSTNIQRRSAHLQWCCLLYNSSTHLRRCRLESTVSIFALAPNQVKVSSWHRTCSCREEQLLMCLYKMLFHHIVTLFK